MKLRIVQFSFVSILLFSCGTTQYQEVGFGGGALTRNSSSAIHVSKNHQKIEGKTEVTSIEKELDFSDVQLSKVVKLNGEKSNIPQERMESKIQKIKFIPRLLNKLSNVGSGKLPKISKVNFIKKKIAESKYSNYNSDAATWNRVFLITLGIGTGLLAIAIIWLMLALAELVPFSWTALAAMATFAQVGLIIIGISLIIGLVALIMSL